MSKFQFQDFFTASLSVAAGTTDTILTMNLTKGTQPTLAADTWVPLVILDSTSPSVYEVVYCSAISGSGYTVRRGMGGSTAQSWSISAIIICAPTAYIQGLVPVAGLPPLWSLDTAEEINGFSIPAIVRDSNGIAWMSTADNNLTTPGATGASWVNLSAIPSQSLLNSQHASSSWVPVNS